MSRNISEQVSFIDDMNVLRAAVPAPERDVPAERAEKLLDVSDGHGILEGLCFDREGTLWFVDCPHGCVYRADVDAGTCEIAFTLPHHGLGSAIKIHKDGRLFITCVASDIGSGIFILSPTGELLDVIATGTGRMIDDMVFASDGSIYYTDLGGTQADPSAGVYYLSSADGWRTEKTVMRSMVASNGIALAPDERHLWVTEYGCGAVHYVELMDDGSTIPPCGSWVAYHTFGLEGPDSCCIDAAGNLYIAMCGQARFLVLSSRGMPVRQTLLPGAEHGQMNKSTHPALRPGTSELYLCASDTNPDSPTYGQSALYVAHGLAPAYKSYQFQ